MAFASARVRWTYQQGSPLPDISPTYFTVNGDGTMDAVFPGGLTIPMSTGGGDPPAGKAIRWRRESDGAIVAYIFTRDHAVEVIAHGPGSEPGEIQLSAFNDDVFQFSRMTLGEVGEAKITTTILDDSVGTIESRLLADGHSRSDYLQRGALPATPRRSLFIPFTLAVNAMGAGASFTTAAFNTGEPFAGITSWSVMGNMTFGGNTHLYTWNANLAAVGADAAIGLLCHNPSAFAGAATTFRGIVFLEYA